jgi:transcriptional regulator PpsR
MWRFSFLVKAFTSPKTTLGDLDAGSAATLLAAASDIALVLDADGVIRDLAVQSDDLAAELGDGTAWIGQSFGATLLSDSVTKAESLLRGDTGAGSAPKWRHLNHATPGGDSLPILYCAVPIGADGRMIAFGRDLRALSALQQRLMNAQQSIEHDYSRLRDMELRYRMLFQTAMEAVLVVDSVRLRVMEVNPAASVALGSAGADLIGRTLDDLIDVASDQAVQAHLSAVRGGLHGEPVPVRLVATGQSFRLSATLFRQENTTLLLLRLVPAEVQGRALPALPDPRSRLLKAVENAPDGFVVADADGRVVAANAAFLEMAQLSGEAQARGEMLDRWVGQSGVDLGVLIANLRQRGSVRLFASTMHTDYGTSMPVEISAVLLDNGGKPCFGFVIRNVGSRVSVQTAAASRLPRSMDQLTELIGRVPLKDLVREATDVIERLCIEAALELTGNNRASAAEMLGLSRQSLYVKLHRYGLGEIATNGRN